MLKSSKSDSDFHPLKFRITSSDESKVIHGDLEKNPRILGYDIDRTAEKLTYFWMKQKWQRLMFHCGRFLLFDINTHVDSGTQDESYKSLVCLRDLNPNPNNYMFIFQITSCWA